MKRHSPHLALLLVVVTLALLSFTLLGSTFQALAVGAPPSLSGAAQSGQGTPTPDPVLLQPTAEPPPVPGETGGILIMAFILVAIIIFGTIWGSISARRRVPLH